VPTAAERTVLKDEPATLVELVHAGEGATVRKTYRNRGLRRLQTFARRSRAAREHDNLQAIAAAGTPCTLAIEWSEQRRLGFVLQSTLVTRFEPQAVPLKRVLAELPANAPARRRLVAAMGALVGAMHRRGILWCTAMPRNVLVVGPPEHGRLVVCDVPAAIVGNRPLHGGRLARIDVFDAAFSPSRRRELSAAQRWRWLRSYCGGDRAHARRLWGPMQRRSVWSQDLQQALAAILFTYILGRFRTRPPTPREATPRDPAP
jgi:hypothetical protein